MTRKWPFRRDHVQPRTGDGPALIHALDGFFNSGSAPVLAAQALRGSDSQIVHEFDLDSMYDYRARRPPIVFNADHYQDYAEPQLLITREHDLEGREYLLLSGPEPDFLWEQFVAETIDVIEHEDVSVTVGIAAIPMGVPHTRPAMITVHATRPELVDRRNLWSTEMTVPSSAQSLLEYRLMQSELDALGYVVHVPHYLSQIEYPTAALALLDAVSVRLGLSFDLTDLKARQPEAEALIAQQIIEQDGGEVLAGLEAQYDSFSRGAAQSLLADDDLPSGDELAEQLERYLARQRKED